MHKSSHDKMSWFKNTYLNDNDFLDILDVGSLDTSGTNYNYKLIIIINLFLIVLIGLITV